MVELVLWEFITPNEDCIELSIRASISESLNVIFSGFTDTPNVRFFLKKFFLKHPFYCCFTAIALLIFFSIWDNRIGEKPSSWAVTGLPWMLCYICGLGWSFMLLVPEDGVITDCYALNILIVLLNILFLFAPMKLRSDWF